MSIPFFLSSFSIRKLTKKNVVWWSGVHIWRRNYRKTWLIVRPVLVFCVLYVSFNCVKVWKTIKWRSRQRLLLSIQKKGRDKNKTNNRLNMWVSYQQVGIVCFLCRMNSIWTERENSDTNRIEHFRFLFPRKKRKKFFSVFFRRVRNRNKESQLT